MADSSPRVACRGIASPWRRTGQLWYGSLASFGTALWAAVLIGLLGTLLILPLKLVLGPVWAITSLGGLISPVSFLFNWIIAVILFGLAAWLIQGFRLKNGLISAVLGAVVYSVISAMVLRAIGIADVDFTRAALLGSFS